MTRFRLRGKTGLPTLPEVWDVEKRKPDPQIARKHADLKKEESAQTAKSVDALSPID
jgi:hypothetical protein